MRIGRKRGLARLRERDDVKQLTEAVYAGLEAHRSALRGVFSAVATGLVLLTFPAGLQLMQPLLPTYGAEAPSNMGTAVAVITFITRLLAAGLGFVGIWLWWSGQRGKIDALRASDELASIDERLRLVDTAPAVFGRELRARLLARR